VTEREIVGHDTCLGCGARVAVARGKKNPSKLFWICDGYAEGEARSCGSRMFYGFKPSRDFLKRAAEASRKPAPAATAAPGADAGNSPRSDVTNHDVPADRDAIAGSGGERSTDADDGPGVPKFLRPFGR
jgi:hypothetical protein